MSSSRLLVGVAIAVFQIIASPSSADSAFCGGKIISIGDRAYEIAARCGSPDFSQAHDEIVDDFVNGEVVQVVEVWAYNSGPHNFIRVITFRNGVVTSIRTGRYGYDKTTAPRPECDERVVAVGEFEGDILVKCGDPAWRNSHEEAVTRGSRTIFVTVDDWTYDAGPNRFVRLLTFRNGRLVSIRAGGYGHKKL